MIEEVNAEWTGEASDATTCVTVKIQDYQKSHTFHGQQIHWIIGYKKKFGSIRLFIDVINKFFSFLTTSISS